MSYEQRAVSAIETDFEALNLITITFVISKLVLISISCIYYYAKHVETCIMHEWLRKSHSGHIAADGHIRAVLDE